MRIERALSLYDGAFLEHQGASWMLPMRERLRSKYLRYTNRIGQEMEQSGQWQQAADRYQKALEVDPLAEELYRRLMVCHWHLQRSAEAMGVYRRCRHVLSTVLSVPPAAETQALYQRIRDSLGSQES
jgi:two-component SAPR family response regulator